MPTPDRQFPDYLPCIELNSGLRRPSLIASTKDSRTIEIYSDSEIDDSDTSIYAAAANGYIISLHNCVPTGSHFTLAANLRDSIVRTTYSVGISVVGHRRWQLNRPVRYVRFDIAGLKDDLFLDKSDFEQKIDYQADPPVSKDIVAFSASGMSIRMRFGGVYVGRKGWRKVKPGFLIEFLDSADINSYLDRIQDITRFFSISHSSFMHVSNVTIDSYNDKTRSHLFENRRYRDTYDVHYFWSGDGGKRRSRRSIRGIFLGNNREELDHLACCLKEWVGRRNLWRSSYRLMMASLRLQGSISTDRLLNAFRWMEELPGVQAVRSISSEHIERISKAAEQEATRLGHTTLAGRIQGALKSLKSESHEERFSRVLSNFQERLGSEFLFPRLVSDLVNAYTVRGKTAHGHYDVGDEEAFRALVVSIYSVELFCFIVTIGSLPLSRAGIDRMSSHPVVENYRHMLRA